MKPVQALHIERLVLHGVSAAEHAQLVQALRSELERLLAQGVSLHALGERLPGARLEVSMPSSAADLGAGAARAIAAQLRAASTAAPGIPENSGRQRGKP